MALTRTLAAACGLWLACASCSSTRVDPLEFDYYSQQGAEAQNANYTPDPAPVSTPTRRETDPVVPIGGTDAVVETPATTTVVVQKGDTLYSLARVHLGAGKRWREIADLNGLTNERRLSVGKELKLPAK